MNRVALTLLCVALLSACSRTSDDAALRAEVAAMGDAIEHREPKALLSRLAGNFTGPDGLDREGVRRLMAFHFLRNTRLHVVLLDVRVQLQGHEHRVARVVARVGLAGGNELVPESGQVYDVTSEWQRSGKAWQMLHADWTPVFAGG